jgi:hypothetical protein
MRFIIITSAHEKVEPDDGFETQLFGRVGSVPGRLPVCMASVRSLNWSLATSSLEAEVSPAQ